MPNKRRLPYIDLLRGFAIILMFITHVYRLHVPATNDSFIIKALFDFFMLIEPLTASLFLFLMGFSLQMTHQLSDNYDEWYQKQKKKALILFGLSVLLCISEEGIFPIRILFSSGILQAIAISIIMISRIFQNKNSSKMLFISFLSTGFIAFCLDKMHLSIIGLNSGSGALFPIIGFAFLGAFISKNHSNFKDIEISLPNIFKIIFALFFIIISTKGQWISIINSNAFGLTFQGFQLKQVAFANWNQTALGFFSTSLIILGIYLFIRNIPMNPNTFIHQFGRYSLELYVFHLAIISIFYIANTGLDGTGLVLLLLIILYTASYKFTLFLNKHKFKLIK
jgi:hypothetical protein